MEMDQTTVTAMVEAGIRELNEALRLASKKGISTEISISTSTFGDGPQLAQVEVRLWQELGVVRAPS